MNGSDNEQEYSLPPCKDFFNCPLASTSPEHRASFLHGCPFGSSCPDLKNGEHSTQFYHFRLPTCPIGKDCQFLIDLEHRITYHHPGERDFLAPCPLGRKCPDRRDPQHTSMYQHCSEPMYPSLPGDLCDKIDKAKQFQVNIVADQNEVKDKQNHNSSVIPASSAEERKEESDPKQNGNLLKRKTPPSPAISPSVHSKETLGRANNGPQIGGSEKGFGKLSSKSIRIVTEMIDREACARGMPPATQLKSMCFQLYDFQLQALSWMKMREEKGDGGILCDEDGLGKTVEVISLIVSSQRRPSLIVVPPTLLAQWEKEIGTHVRKAHELKVCIYNEPFRRECNSKGSSEKIFMEYDVAITDFTSVMRERKSNGPLFKKAWYRIVIDEAHTIKSASTDLFGALSELRARKKWCVTGTPIRNSLNELWDFVSLVGPDSESKVRSKEIFEESIIKPFLGNNISDDFKCFVKTYFIRRTRETTTDEGKPLVPLPPCHLEDRFVVMKPIFRSFYSKVEELTLSAVRGLLKREPLDLHEEQIFAHLLRLRQCTDHPFIPLRSAMPKDGPDTQKWDFEALLNTFNDIMNNNKINEFFSTLDMSDELKSVVSGTNELDVQLPPKKRAKGNGTDGSTLETFSDVDSSTDSTFKPVASSLGNEEEGSSKNLFSQEDCLKEFGNGLLVLSPKIDEIVDIYKRHLAGDPNLKVAVFSRFSSFLDLVQCRLRYENIPLCRIDSSKSSDTVTASFKESKSSMVILATHKMDSPLLDLACANVVIISDPWWDPATDLQIIQQVHRIGQKKSVYAYKLYTKDTIEDTMKTIMGKSFSGCMHIQAYELIKEIMMNLESK